ncbi:hypothetical protein ACPCBC_17015 [Streptomyces incarnatus]
MGGEPTLHPGFGERVEHVLSSGLKVIVYSNLYRVRAEHWEFFARPGVSLAASYYADTDDGHDEASMNRAVARSWRDSIPNARSRTTSWSLGDCSLRHPAASSPVTRLGHAATAHEGRGAATSGALP